MGTLQLAGIGLLALLLSSGAAYFAGYERGYRIATLEIQAATTQAIAKAASDARLQQMAADQISYNISLSFAQEQTKIVGLTITQIRQVDHYVPMEVNKSCVLPLSIVQLFNASAAGVDDPSAAFPLSAGQLASDPASTDLASLASTVIENDGKYHAVAAQLGALIRWIGDQKALHK